MEDEDVEEIFNLISGDVNPDQVRDQKAKVDAELKIADNVIKNDQNPATMASQPLPGMAAIVYYSNGKKRKLDPELTKSSLADRLRDNSAPEFTKASLADRLWEKFGDNSAENIRDNVRNITVNRRKEIAALKEDVKKLELQIKDEQTKNAEYTNKNQELQDQLSKIQDSCVQYRMNRTKPKHVLSVGLAYVNFINVVATYPKEDSDKRGENYYWQRGGNASNMCSVLNLLSTPCEFMGVLGTVGAEASWLINDFKKYNIQTDKCVLKDVQCPVTTSILCKDTGSRTIIHYPRDRLELSYNEFNQKFNVDGLQYSWIHFELSSNISDVCQMMQSVLTSHSSQFDHDEGPAAARATTKPVVEKQPNVFGDEVKSNSSELTTGRAVVSLEVEKPELANAEEAIGYADVVFISKDFAKSRGFSDGATAVAGLYALCKPGAVLICAWGDKGASACYSCKQGRDFHVIGSPVVQNINIVDSLGAGDSFVAGVIPG